MQQASFKAFISLRDRVKATSSIDFAGFLGLHMHFAFLERRIAFLDYGAVMPFVPMSHCDA
jgi:hypothetical protein